MAEAGLLRAALTGGGSLDKLSYLLAAMELADRLLPEREPVEAVAGMYRRFLDHWHDEGPEGMPALFFALETALLDELGLSTDLWRCGECGRRLEEGEAAFFRPAEGDLCCRACAGGNGVWVAEQDLGLWRLLSGFLDRPEAAPALEDQQKRKIGTLLHLHMMHHLPRYRIPASLFWLKKPDEGEGEKR